MHHGARRLDITDSPPREMAFALDRYLAKNPTAASIARADGTMTADWAEAMVDSVSSVKRRRDDALRDGSSGGNVRNAQRVDRITTLQDVPGWSVMPSTSEYALHCGEGGYLPPSDFAAFVEDQTRGKREHGLTL